MLRITSKTKRKEAEDLGKKISFLFNFCAVVVQLRSLFDVEYRHFKLFEYIEPERLLTETREE
jgi:hypothetical protein